jgi:hypothetical protein
LVVPNPLELAGRLEYFRIAVAVVVAYKFHFVVPWVRFRSQNTAEDAAYEHGSPKNCGEATLPLRADSVGTGHLQQF